MLLLPTIGAVLSMKSVIKYEALLDQKKAGVSELKRAALEIWGSQMSIDVDGVIKKVLTAPPPPCTADDNADILLEAEECVRAITLNQKGSRAA